MKKLRLARDGYIIMSVVFYIAGLAYMFLPGLDPLTLCVTGGVVLIVYGIIKMMGYFSNDLYCLAFQYDLACGLLLMVLGVIVLACNQRIIAHLSADLGVLVLLDSLLSIQTAKDAKQFGLQTWSVILATSIIAAVFSVLLIVKPYRSQVTAHIVAGGTLLAEGLKNHCVVLLTVKTMKRHMPENEEYNYKNKPGGNNNGCFCCNQEIWSGTDLQLHVQGPGKESAQDHGLGGQILRRGIRTSAQGDPGSN